MIPTPPPTPLGLEPALSSRKTRERRIVLLLLLVVINLGLFLPSMTGDFLWDDKYFISENPSIQGPGFIRSFLFSPFGGFSGTDESSVLQDRVMRFYRPFVSLSYWLDFKVWGLNPAAFHLTNILIHLVNVTVIFLILIGLAFSPRGAFFGAFLFSVYPLHFENVSWISGRTDLLAGLFAGLSVLFFIHFLNSRAHGFLVGSSVAYFLGLLCKENVILLPLIFLLILYKKERARGALSRLWSYGVGFLGWLALRWQAVGPASVGTSGRGIPDLLAAIGFYAWKTVYPFHLSLTVDSLPVLKSAAFRLLGAILIGVFLLCFWQASRKKLAAGWPYWAFLSWLLLLLPSAAVILSPSTISLLAWRFLYLPSAVLIGALVYCLDRPLRLRGVAVGAAVLLAVLGTAEIYPKNKQFGKDETSFWLSIKRPEREDVIARFNVAVKTLPTDEKKALRLFDGIVGRTDQPAYLYWKTRVFEELGVYYAFRRDFAKAQSYFDELFRLEARPSLRLSFNYAFYLAFSGKGEEGEKTVSETLSRFPENHFALVQAAKFFVIVHNYGRAAELYARDFRLFRSPQSAALAREAALLEQKTR